MFELSAKEESQHLHSMRGIMATVGIDCKALKTKWFMLARRKREQRKIEFNSKSWEAIRWNWGNEALTASTATEISSQGEGAAGS